MNQFQVELPQYCGPFDLLLHIVRREEIDLSEIPLAAIIDQYFLYLEVLVELEIDDVGDFLEIASVLMEWKSKQAIPAQDNPESSGSQDNAFNDYSDDLVQRLLEYKRYRDAATALDDQGRRWQLRFSRLANDLPTARPGTNQQPIEPIEIWDLVSAFGRILRDRKPPLTTEVVFDDTPIQVHMVNIHRLLKENQRIELTALFQPKMHKSALIGLFLATLELTRHHGVTTDQPDPCRPLYLVAGDRFIPTLDLSGADQN